MISDKKGREIYDSKIITDAETILEIEKLIGDYK